MGRQCLSEERSSELILHLLMRMCMKAPLRKINNLRNIKEAVSRTVFDNELIGMECKTEEVTKVTVPENARDDRHGQN